MEKYLGFPRGLLAIFPHVLCSQLRHNSKQCFTEALHYSATMVFHVHILTSWPQLIFPAKGTKIEGKKVGRTEKFLIEQ